MIIPRGLEASIDSVYAHEDWLIRSVTFTNEERQRVIELFDEEREAIWDSVMGKTVNVTRVRADVARKRVEISRRARRRAS